MQLGSIILGFFFSLYFLLSITRIFHSLFFLPHGCFLLFSPSFIFQHAHIHTHRYVLTDIYIWLHTSSYICAHIQTPNIYIYVGDKYFLYIIHTSLQQANPPPISTAQTHTHVRTHTHTYVHTHTHTHTHIYIYIYIYISAFVCASLIIYIFSRKLLIP